MKFRGINSPNLPRLPDPMFATDLITCRIRFSDMQKYKKSVDSPKTVNGLIQELDL
jgi:hypothetical protein